MKPSNWQPIETAPRDGTQILLSNEGTLQICWWGAARQGWSYGGGNWIEDRKIIDGKAIDYLFWHPLPVPPLAREREEV